LLLSAACSDETLEFFFDIPPPTPEELAEEAQREREQAEQAAQAQRQAEFGLDFVAPEEGEPPAIEAVVVWKQAAEMLPKDDLDEADWVAALREGVIAPRNSIPGSRPAERIVFGFDFYLPGPDPSFDAYFPHSVHTEWLGCESCHPKIFRTRGTQISMDEVFAGEYCGVCHGVVAFSLDNCTRCHTAME
jgi:c(7)-type cytochrome triheme protein